MGDLLSFSEWLLRGGNDADIVATNGTVVLNANRLVLQFLLVVQVVEDAVGSDTLDELIEIKILLRDGVLLCLGLLHLGQLLFGHGLDLIRLFEVFFMTNVRGLVRFLKRVVVVSEALNETIVFLFLIGSKTTQPVNDAQ